MRERVLALLAVAVVFATCCAGLGRLPLLAPDEGRNAEVGREMSASGAWLVPTYNGVDYLDKPAFYFKAVAISLSLFGTNETAARLPSAMFGVALAGLVYVFCRKVHSRRCALLATIIVATMPLFFAYARTVIFDIALAFFVCAAIFAGYLAEETEGKFRRNWYLVGAAVSGFATLVKGPVGFVIPVLVLLIFYRVERRGGAWKRLLAPLNLLVFFGVTLPWFVGLCVAHRDFLHYGLVEESFNRFTTAKKFHRSEPFYFYLLIVASTLLPWSFLLPEATIATWKQRWAKHSADRLCLIWSVVVVIFFSISQSKLPQYILSVAVACGILLARLFDVALMNADGYAARLVRRATLAFAVVCLLTALVVGVGGTQARLLAKPLHITPEDAQPLGQAALPMAVASAACGVFAIVACARRNLALCFLVLALFLPVCGSAGFGVMKVIFDVKSGRSVAARMPPLLPAETELACLECFPNGVPFYLQRTATLISRNGAELTSNYIIATLEKNSQWPNPIVPLDRFEAWLGEQRKPVYLIVRKNGLHRLEDLASSRGGTVQQLAPELWGAQISPSAPLTRAE
jgi:4-amino-4-deoxy-L-arabinose transferase-like glycosyltransferase